MLDKKNPPGAKLASGRGNQNKRLNTSSNSAACTRTQRPEIWKSVHGWEGLYRVSNYGRIKSLTREVRSVSKGGGEHRRTVPDRILKPYPTIEGQLTIRLCRDGAQISVLMQKLVAESFLGPRPKGHETCHLNGDRSDNAVWNLKYVTRRENVAIAMARGTFRPASGIAGAHQE